MKKVGKTAVEILLVKAALTGTPAKRLPVGRHLGQVDLVWPRTGVARKSAAREMSFRRGVADFTAEPWAKRCLLREEIEGKCGVAVTVFEPVGVQKIRRFFRTAAKYALKQGADFVESAMAGYGDLASAPVDALAALVGEKDAPRAIARGVADFSELPAPGEEKALVVKLERPLTGKAAGTLELLVRG